LRARTSLPTHKKLILLTTIRIGTPFVVCAHQGTHRQNLMNEGTRRLATVPKELLHYRELSCRRNRKKQNSEND